MAVSYVNRKCDCGGKLMYKKEIKAWECIYCGSVIEREERYDGLFTIKNVVRQTLKDIAYRNLENAEKNLTECEKIDSRYIGTIIANLAYLIIKVTSPGACGESEVKSIFARIKKSNDMLQTEFEGITDEEEVLYEFFDTSDIYATLLLVYDSLNDKKRRDFMTQLLKPGDIFSIDTNKSLLVYALKNGDFSMLDGIANNTNNIDKKFALSEILGKYPDGDKKIENVEKLFKEKAFTKEDKTLLDNYFNSTTDSITTKARVVNAASASGIKPSLDIILKNVLSENEDVTIAKDVLSQVCSSKLTDEEVYKIVEYCFSYRNIKISLSGLSCLKNTEQYVVLGPKHILTLLSRNDIDGEEKLCILKEAYGFNIDNKSREAIINNYLCLNQDESEIRRKIIPFLLETVKTVPTNAFENYVLKCKTDGASKPEIVESVLRTDINISFYHDLLSRYIFTDTDDMGTKENIITLLLDKGIKVEPKAFSRYICNASDKGAGKINLIKKMLANGSVLNSDTVSTYLEGIRNYKEFDSDLFALLFNDSCIITDNALVNYVLHCKDKETIKVKNALAMANRTSISFGSQLCRINHGKNVIECNLLQAYILTSLDIFAVTIEIVRQMINSKTKINSEIRVVGGKGQKFKKYLVDNSEHLSQATLQICEEYKVFSKFFW
jgi:hypothetical protein